MNEDVVAEAPSRFDPKAPSPFEFDKIECAIPAFRRILSSRGERKALEIVIDRAARHRGVPEVRRLLAASIRAEREAGRFAATSKAAFDRCADAALAVFLRAP